jgi:hypothetical protein
MLSGSTWMRVSLRMMAVIMKACLHVRYPTRLPCLPARKHSSYLRSRRGPEESGLSESRDLGLVSSHT